MATRQISIERSPRRAVRSRAPKAGRNATLEARHETSDQDLRAIIDATPALIWWAGPKGRTEAVNQTFLDYVGLTSEEIKGGWTRSIHPDDRDGIAAVWASLRESGVSGQGEVRLRRHDGEYRWFLVRANPLRDETGAIIRWCGINTDIEDRKTAELALAIRERSLTEAIDRFPANLSFVTGAGANVSLSQHFWDFTGLAPDPAEPVAWLNAYHPEDRDRMLAKFGSFRLAGEGGVAEGRLRRQDGVYRWFQIRTRPFRDECGHIVRWYTVGIDIEDLKQTEAALQRAYRDLNHAQKLSRTGSYTNDYAAREHLWSDELYRIFEFEPGTKITGRAALNAVHPDDRAAFSAAITKSAADGSDIDLTYRIVPASGKVKHLHSISRTYGAEENRPVFVGAVQDITDTKAAEEARDKARSELAYAARAMSLGVLTASIAHEVNQPLSGILTNATTGARMLSIDVPNVEGARDAALRTIRDAKRASEVIARLRTLFGRREFVFEAVDLGEAAREVLALSGHELRRNQIELRTEFAEHLPRAPGDRVQLQQVMLNLILNAADAVKAIDAGSRQVLVKTELDTAGAVRFSVRDTGVGVAPDQAGKLFDAFYTTKHDGMGIGLSVSRSIIERHGGRLWATPNDGPGATFAFSVPYASNPETTS